MVQIIVSWKGRATSTTLRFPDIQSGSATVIKGSKGDGSGLKTEGWMEGGWEREDGNRLA
jgi:hypothetical protein